MFYSRSEAGLSPTTKSQKLTVNLTVIPLNESEFFRRDVNNQRSPLEHPVSTKKPERLHEAQGSAASFRPTSPLSNTSLFAVLCIIPVDSEGENHFTHALCSYLHRKAMSI